MVSRDGFSFSKGSMRLFFAFLCEMGFKIKEQIHTLYLSVLLL